MWSVQAFVLFAVSLTHACPFASRSATSILPPDHPAVHGRRLLDAPHDAGHAPDSYVPSNTGGRFTIFGGGINAPRPSFSNKTTADLLDQMAKASVANGSGPLCYWSWQSLPPPIGYGDGGSKSWGTRGSYDFAAMEKVHTGSVAAIRDLCTYAVARLQAHIDPIAKSGINVLAAVTEGTEFGSYLCHQGLHRDKDTHPERCAKDAPLYNQSWGLRWPMSVTMWKFDGTNKDAVSKLMLDWRNNPDQHLPNIMSPSPSPSPSACAQCDQCAQCCTPEGFSCATCTPCSSCFESVCHSNSSSRPIPTGAGSDGGEVPMNGTGWGPGGALVGKAIPCNSIPEQFMYQKPYPQDTSPLTATATADKTYLDAAMDFWSNTEGWPFPKSKCGTAMENKCSAAKNKTRNACEACGVLHFVELKLAGCSTNDVIEWCTSE